MKTVPKLTIFRCPLGDVATPVAPVQASIRKSAANLNDVNCVRLQAPQCERLNLSGCGRCLRDTKHTCYHLKSWSNCTLSDDRKMYLLCSNSRTPSHRSLFHIPVPYSFHQSDESSLGEEFSGNPPPRKLWRGKAGSFSLSHSHKTGSQRGGSEETALCSCRLLETGPDRQHSVRNHRPIRCPCAEATEAAHFPTRAVPFSLSQHSANVFMWSSHSVQAIAARSLLQSRHLLIGRLEKRRLISLASDRR